MDTIINHHEAIALLLARVFLGLLFVFQGYDAIFKVKISAIVETFEAAFASKGIPKFLTVAGAWFTSYVQLAGGIALIVGIFKYYALYLLGIDLIIASIAFGITTPMWDMRFVFPRLALILLLLLIPEQWDIYSIDHLIINP